MISRIQVEVKSESCLYAALCWPSEVNVQGSRLEIGDLINTLQVTFFSKVFDNLGMIT